MKQAKHQLWVETTGPGLLDITRDIEAWVKSQSIVDGLLTTFIQHTSASLVIQENADPDVLKDLMDFFSQVAPEIAPYRHRSEGADDMPAHIKSALTQTHLSIPIVAGSLALGTWQGIYLFEHRAQPHRRQIALHLIGE